MPVAAWGAIRSSSSKAPVPGKITVVDFGAKWCGPCHEIDKAMAQILQSQPEVALRKVDIVDWDSPVAAQQMKNVEGLPYVLVFDRTGKRVAAEPGMTVASLQAAIAGAK